MKKKSTVMIIPYVLSVKKDNALLLTQTLKKVTGDDFICKDGRIIVPAGQGEGSVDFYDLQDGIALIIVNCSFHQPYLFKRRVNEQIKFCYFALNFSDKNITFKASDNNIAQADVTRKRICTTSNTDMEITVPSGSRFKLVVIKCSAIWIENNLGVSTEEFNKMMAYGSLHRQLLRVCLPEIRIAIRNGIKKVFGDESTPHPVTHNEDTARINAFKNNIIDKLHENLPTLEGAAKQCLMSIAKFSRLFKKIFKTSYAGYFWDKRLMRSCALLENGLPVKEVSLLCGYSSTAAFSKAFKEKYQISPLNYQKNVMNE